MGVAEHKARILEICATFDGVISTPQGSMRHISSMEMPAFTVLTGSATHTMIDSQTLETVRQYRLILMAMPVDIGLEFEAEALCEPFYPLVEVAFSERPGLYLVDQTDALDGVQDTNLISDGGFQVTQFAELGVAGSEFVIQVTYITSIQQGW